MKMIKDYFKSEADYYEFFLLHMSGDARTTHLGIHEGLYGNKQAAREWAEDLLNKIGNNYEAISEVKRIYKRMTGEEFTADIIREEPTNEEPTNEEPKKFTVGGVAVDHQGRTEKVMKVTKCYVWFTYCGNENELEKRKIKRDSYGNEFVEYQESGWGRGCNGYYRYNAA